MVNGIIDTHLVSSSTPDTNSSTTVLPMHFNHQRNNARTSSSGIWQNNKTGNPAIDPYAHMAQQARACTTSSLRRGKGGEDDDVGSIAAQHSSKTSTAMNCMVGSEATKQISCNRNSKENTSLSTTRDGNDGEYRLLSCAINNKIRCRAMSMSTNGGADECTKNQMKNPATTTVQLENAPKRDLSDHCNPQMPSSSSFNVHVQSQKFLIPVSLTKNASESSAAITCNGDSQRHDDAANRCNNINNVVDVNRMNVVECNQNRNNNNNNTSNSDETGGAVETMSDDLTITSAIETLASTSSHDSQNKAKYTSEIVTMREKRRRNRRDRRQARTRASTSEILPDILNNPRPPPYSSLPPQVPSIISTVPVEDTRYVFSLPLVRR